jgi:hypothetical protein
VSAKIKTLILLACLIAPVCLWFVGFVTVLDRGGEVVRAAVNYGIREVPMTYLGGGLYLHVWPEGDGSIKLLCRDRSVADTGYITSGPGHTHITVEGNCDLLPQNPDS